MIPPGTANDPGRTFGLPSRVPRLVAYALLFPLLSLLTRSEGGSLEALVVGVVAGALWLLGMWTVWGRNHLTADGEGIHSRNYWTLHEHAWADLRLVMWRLDLLRQMDHVDVLPIDSPPGTEAKTICTIVPIGPWSSKRLAARLGALCQENGVEFR